MKKFTVIGLMAIIILIAYGGAVQSRIVEYEFSGTYTEGDLAGWDFNGTVTFDTEWEYDESHIVQFWGYTPKVQFEDYTGEMLLGPYGRFYAGTRFGDSGDRSANSIKLWGSDNYMTTGFETYIDAAWSDPGIESGELIPLNRLTEAYFKVNAWRFFAWYDGQDVHGEDWYGAGPITELRLVPEQILIDIKPGSETNCIKIKGHGVISVAILGSETLDVTQIDINTLKFAGLDVKLKGKSRLNCSIKDVSGDFTDPDGAPDGHDDLVCKFVGDPNAWSSDNGTATLTGALLDGMPIEGTDTICIVPKKNQKTK